MCILCCAAEIRKDVSSQYHNTLYTGDVAERVKLLRTVGQGLLLKHATYVPLCIASIIRHVLTFFMCVIYNSSILTYKCRSVCCFTHVFVTNTVVVSTLVHVGECAV